jgi:hypothetical protein
MDMIFLVGWLSTSPLNGLFASFSNIFVIIKWFAFTCFFNVVIPFICSNFKVTKQDWINNTSHDLWTFHINILLIIQKKKPNIKKFYHATSKLFSEHAIFLCFISLVFLHFLELVTFCLKAQVYSHSCKHFSITSFMNTSHVFSFSKD